MKETLCISVRFLHSWTHARDGAGEPEWPPSPLRLVQALVAASAGRWNERDRLVSAAPAIQWLEGLPPPRIIAARAVAADRPHRFYVPDNSGDRVVRSWLRGSDEAVSRTHKDARATYLDGDSLFYLYGDAHSDDQARNHLTTLTLAARAMTHLGWGVDAVVGDAVLLKPDDLGELAGQTWQQSSSGSITLRTAKPGTLSDLMRRHEESLNRFRADGAHPVPPLRVFDYTRYRRDTDSTPRPCLVFRLLDDNDDTVTYPQARMMHIAGMVRHLAIEAMKRNPPRDLRGGQREAWVESYVAGHRSEQSETPHAQLSYLPLQSIGHAHTDPGVRRVMIVAPVGDEAWLEHLAQQLDGQLLKPLPNTTLPPGAYLRRVAEGAKDGVRDAYLRASNTWRASHP